MLLALIEDCIRSDASANLCKTVADSFFMETSIFVTDLAQQFSLSVGGPSHPVVVPLRVARAGRRGFSDPRSFLPFSLSAACLKFFAFRFRAAPPGDDPTLIDA
jgi:hypothetical protein